MKNYKNIDSYIAGQPKVQQDLLKILYKNIKKQIPRAEEAIRYGMPTFRLNNKNILHFAGYKNHIGFYPAPSAILKFAKELSIYKTSKGAIQFPIDKSKTLKQNLPLPLINKIIKFRVKENSVLY